jgi:FAD/FMN-containing dehydrogenase
MNISRRTFLKGAGLATLATTCGCRTVSETQSPVLVNDVHTQLNPTRVRSISSVNSLDDLRRIIRRARREHRPVSVAAGRHAAGGQQFATDTELIDTRELRRVLNFDREVGTIEVETGIQWPELMACLRASRTSETRGWTAAQKQTGTDRLSIGGALSSNAHGRGLTLPPFISTVESFVLVDAKGNVHTCSRRENSELFKLAIGGYGLFGFIYSAKLRLVPLRKVRRVVKMAEVADLPGLFAERIAAGFIYGDFQFAIDSKSDDFLKRGILACYEPVPDATPLPTAQKALSGDDWKMLIYLAHTDPSRAFDLYAKHYLATSGQVYESDTQYVSDYFDDYHRELDTKMQTAEPATEVIGELNVPRNSLPQFLEEAREELRRKESPSLIYGTIRLIEKDTESFLPWAKQSYACVIFNLHTPHSPEGKSRTANAFRRLIDLALQHGGSYYLTYHRYATRQQLLACYPQFPELLRRKLHYDPDERFQSDWYRHYKRMFV